MMPYAPGRGSNSVHIDKKGESLGSPFLLLNRESVIADRDTCRCGDHGRRARSGGLLRSDLNYYRPVIMCLPSPLEELSPPDFRH